MALIVLVAALSFIVASVSGLDNGLARTPPMGWLTWERFRCNTDCDNDPKNCISENLMKEMADAMVAGGFRDAGYEYVIVDDCWLDASRAPDGQLRPDPKRFPNGIKALADYIHSKGLKFGIYEDFGTHTCAGYPGSEYYMQMDAQTFADWGVDYLKLDGCYANVQQYDDGYPAMTMFLNMTKRPIVFSCSWPAYQEGHMTPNYKKIAQNCNLWRNYADIQDSYDSLKGIINFYGDDKTKFVEIAAPGQFNDPDMLIIGNFGLSRDQERMQMGMWAIMASPLIMSADLRTIRQDAQNLLTNKHVLAINQDSLGRQGMRIAKNGNIQVWTRPLSGGSLAFALLNFGAADPTRVSIKLTDLGLSSSGGYHVNEVFDQQDMGKFMPNATFTTYVNPSGIFLGKADPVTRL